MNAALDLVKLSRVTHTAVKSGRWDDPDTWQDGRIPGRNSKVHIPENLTVTYGTISNVRHDTVRVDGTLKFAKNESSRLLLDTMVVTNSGELEIGTARNPIAANQTVDIVFSSNTDIATANDPQKIRRGLLNMGKATIVGRDKLDHIKLQKEALAGDSELVLDLPDGMNRPQGWRVGDRLVLGGTNYSYNGSDEDNSRFQDEVLEITRINGNRIQFRNVDIQDGPQNVLRFDHTLPDVREKGQLDLYVANTTRNVTFSSEDGEDTPIARRGHTMFMMNPDVEIRNAGFVGLGRSDKSQVVDDPGQNVDGSSGNGTNRRGRYSLHLHRLPNNTYDGESVILSGNAVVGSPGWGIVAHSSKADISDNVVFDVVGAGIVAEGGNEQGGWWNNIVIKTTGVDWREALRTQDERDRLFDFGFQGDAYWIQGAGQVAFQDNIAISSNESGLTVFGDSLDPDNDFRDAETIAVSDLPPEIRDLVAPNGQDRVDVTDVPLRLLSGLESYNANVGFRLWGHQTNFDGTNEFSSPEPTTAHNLRSTISDLTLWGNRSRGLQVLYSTQVDFEDGLVIGDVENPGRIRVGVSNNHATFNNTFDNFTVQGFERGFTTPYNGPDGRERNYLESTLSNSRFRDNTFHLSPTRRAADSVLGDDFPLDLILRNNRFSAQAGNEAPEARFRSQALGGLTVEFNGGQSRDLDPVPSDENGAGPTSSRGIVAYGWDFDNNGTIDATGRKASYQFDSAGTKRVTLTVWDGQGQATTLERSIQVEAVDYQNPFIDSTFNSTNGYLAGWQADNQWAGDGWFTTTGVTRDPNGFAVLSNQNHWSAGIGQTIQNDKLHQGQQRLSFRLRNIEGAPEAEYWRNNTITVNLWGVNGQFSNSGWSDTGPERSGTLPFRAKNLFTTTIGGRESEADRDSFDWRTFNRNVSLGRGYQFLVFQVNTQATRDAGDIVAIDNVRLTGDAPSATLPPTSDEIVGTSAADRLTGTTGNDQISGLGGNDLLLGDLGNDSLNGGAGSDRLRGTTFKSGEREIDQLRGGGGRDRFVLGTKVHQFYLNQSRPGNASYALIEDFQVNQDKLVLKGDETDYRLGIITIGGEQGTGVFYKEKPGEDLVAFLRGVTDVTAVRNRL